MKILYININGEDIQSSENVMVVGTPKDNIIDKFYYELGKEIAKGVDVPDIRGFAKHIVKSYMDKDEMSFGKITEQWLKVKDKLLGKNPTGSETIELPMDYVKWLHNYGGASHTEIAKSLYTRKRLVEISLDKIYGNSVNIIINSIKPDKYGQFVVNDEVVTDDSAISIAIMKKFDGIAFKPYKKEDVCPKCGKNPCECKNKEHSSFLLIAKETELSSNYISLVKGITIYNNSLSEIYSRETGCISLEIGWGIPKEGDTLNLFVGVNNGLGGSYDIIGFDGNTAEVKYDECPWNKQRPCYSFSKDAFLKMHPEYEDCEKPYHEIEKDDYIIQTYKKGAHNLLSFTVDVWNSKDKLLCTLPEKTGIDRVLPSGLYVIVQWIDENYLVYGIADKYGKILLPCKYKKNTIGIQRWGLNLKKSIQGLFIVMSFPTKISDIVIIVIFLMVISIMM